MNLTRAQAADIEAEQAPTGEPVPTEESIPTGEQTPTQEPAPEQKRRFIWDWTQCMYMRR